MATRWDVAEDATWGVVEGIAGRREQPGGTLRKTTVGRCGTRQRTTRTNRRDALTKCKVKRRERTAWGVVGAHRQISMQDDALPRTATVGGAGWGKVTPSDEPAGIPRE